MIWTQFVNPLDNIFLSALLAILPIVFIFWALIIRKMKGYAAILLANVIAIGIAVLFYHMPVKLALMSTFHGALYGLFPICWLIVSAIFLFNLTVKSGKFEVIKYSISSISADRRIQALLIAFSFGAFLEGTAGFGAPVAITAAMLIGLGFNPLYAAGLCLIANTAPVAFGSVGIPITVASQVSDLPEMAISQMIGRTLPILSLFLPLYLVVLMAGFKRSIEVFPAILVSGLSFAFFQWFTANYLGPMLPDVIAGVFSMVSLIVLLRFWKPKTIWRFKDEPSLQEEAKQFTSAEIVTAWSPFIILTMFILTWGLQPAKNSLDSMGLMTWEIPGLHNLIKSNSSEKLISQVFKLNFLSTPGTSILMAGFISIPLVGLKFKEGLTILFQTIRQLRFPILTIASVLGFAYIVNNSGISITLADALANTGTFFPFFSAFLGWLGVFITGSDTSSNALFGKLQHATATSIGVDPVVTVAANCSGGVAGKMISPQSIAVAAAATGLIGQESALFRFTVWHSFVMLLVISLIVVVQAYVFTWVVPTYEVITTQALMLLNETMKGYWYLLSLFIVLLSFLSFLIFGNKKSVINR